MSFYGVIQKLELGIPDQKPLPFILIDVISLFSPSK